MRATRSTAGEWTLHASANLKAAELIDGISALEQEMAGGPKQQIAMAIVELLGATDRPPQLSEEEAVARTAALQSMAWDYPIDVVQTACREWRKVPKAGRWWPTEQDLRAQCEPLVKARRDLHAEARNLLSSLRAQEGRRPGQRSFQPHGKTQKFVEACMASFGPAFCKSWLSHRTCDFSEDTIYTIGLSVDRLTQNCSGLLKQHGVKLERCNDVTKRFYDDEDARAPSAPPKKRKP